jgi:hypothetical protein
MKKTFLGILLFFVTDYASAQTCVKKVEYRGGCYYQQKNSTTINADLKYRAATVRCANDQFKFVHTTNVACATKDQLDALAETACAQSCTSRENHVKSPTAPVMRPLDSRKSPEPPVMRPLDTAKSPQPPVMRPLDITKSPQPPVMRPLDITKSPQPPVMRPLDPTKAPVSGGSVQPQPPVSGTSTALPDSRNSGEPSTPVPSPPPTSPSNTDSTSVPPASSSAYTGSFYSVRVGLSVNSTANTAEVTYLDTTMGSNGYCASSRYVLHLDLSNASNAAFINNAVPAATYQTVNLHCPSIPTNSYQASYSGARAASKVVNYPLGCVVDSALNGGSYTAPKCMIP